MAYRELIKDFSLVRDYLRQFYVYGFKTRREYDAKSPRTYDDERQRIGSWLGDFMSFRMTAAGKNIFLTVDSRAVAANPLYRVFKAKSFTDKAVTLHFFLMDILADGQPHDLAAIGDALHNDYLAGQAAGWDESTIRKKLQEYAALGLIKSARRGRKAVYQIADDLALSAWRDAAAFFSEVLPLGVVGSYLLDKPALGGECPARRGGFDFLRFKHHYLLSALDSQIIYDLLLIIGDRRAAEIAVGNPPKHVYTVLPLKIYASTQTGRYYLYAYHYHRKKPGFFRLDRVSAAKPLDEEKDYAKYAKLGAARAAETWGVSAKSDCELKDVELIVRVEDDEDFIVQRLWREQRGGTVTALDGNTYRFHIAVSDAMEMLPWLRTFIGRIVRLSCSNPAIERIFYNDLAAMQTLYAADGAPTDAAEGGDGNAVS